MFEAIQNIGSILGLIAFIIAAGVSLLKHLADRDIKIIEAASEDKRPELIKKALKGYEIPTDKLTQAQQFSLFKAEIAQRDLLFSTIAKYAFYIFAMALIVVLIISIYQPTQSKTDKPKLSISGADGIENGIYIVNFSVPNQIRSLHLKNNSDSLLEFEDSGFPSHFFYSTLRDDALNLPAHSSREFQLVFMKGGLYDRSEYLFELTESHTNTKAKIKIRLNGDWEAYHQNQIKRLNQKVVKGGSPKQFYTAAKQMLEQENKQLEAPLREALVGQFLSQANQPEAAAIAYYQAAQSRPKIVKRLVKEPAVIAALGHLYKADNNYKKAAGWFDIAAKMGNVEAQNELDNLNVDGNEVKADTNKSNDWFLRSTTQSNVIANNVNQNQTNGPQLTKHNLDEVYRFLENKECWGCDFSNLEIGKMSIRLDLTRAETPSFPTLPKHQPIFLALSGKRRLFAKYKRTESLFGLGQNIIVTHYYLIVAEIPEIYRYKAYEIDEFFDDAIQFLGASLEHYNLARANLTGTNLAGANLTGTNLAEANLTEANLTEANLTGADLKGAILTGADLTGADLTGADLTDAFLFETIIEKTKLADAKFE